MGKNRKNRVIEVEITGFSSKGNGIGKVFSEEKEPLFEAEVPFAIPGDICQAKVLRKRKSRYLSTIESLIVPSSIRIAPKCVHFGVCGGCRWQQMSYDEQLKEKERILRKCFHDILQSGVDLRPIIPCEPVWQYRNKMEYTFSSDLQKNKFLGLVMDGGKGRVLNLTECHLVSPWYTTALEAVREWWNKSGIEAYHPFSNLGSLRTLTLREAVSSGDRMVVLTVSGNPDYAIHKSDLEDFVRSLRKVVEPADPEKKLSIFLRIQQLAKGMPTNFFEMLLYGPDHIREELEVNINDESQPSKLMFHISPSAFFQPNSYQAQKLYSYALRMAELKKEDVVYDLYCGTGTLGICASRCVKSVFGIEVSPEAALDARMNAKLNGAKNVTIICGAVRHVLHQIQQDGNSIHSADLVIIDPPRTGLDQEALQRVLSLKSKKILYVSCNPETQAVNVTEFLKHGYAVVAIQPVDQFAQTAHIENIVLLKRVDS